MDFEQLEALVESGDVDTVVTAFPDHFGLHQSLKI